MNLNIIFNKIKKILPKKWYWILEHEGFRKYFSNTGWMFFGRFFNLLISFFVGVWVIRYLGPENYGSLSYAVSFVSIFSVLAGLGLDNILKRNLVNNPEKRDVLMGTTLRLKLFGALFSSILISIVVFLINLTPILKVLIFLYSFVFIFHSFNILNIFFESKVQAKRGVKAQILASFISAILKICLIYFGLGVIWLVSIYVLDTVWIALGFLYNYRKMGLKIFNWNFDKKIARKMLSDSWLLILTGVSALVYMKIDQIMIKHMIDESAVGLYSASVRIIEFTQIVPAIICSSLAPAIFNAKKTDLNIYKSRLINLVKLIFLISFFIILPISIFSKYIINFLLGPDYFNSYIALSIGIWSLLGISLAMVINQYLIAENYIKILFFSSLVGAIANLVLNYIFIPIHGINGAASVTVFSYSIIFLIPFLFKKVRIVFKKKI